MLDKGTRPAQFGKAVGEMVGGFFTTAFGMTGEVVGSGLTVTGIGALLGVPAIAVSATLVTAGAGNMAAGLAGFAQAMSTGGGSGSSAAAPKAELAAPKIQRHHIFPQKLRDWFADHPRYIDIDKYTVELNRDSSCKLSTAVAT